LPNAITTAFVPPEQAADLDLEADIFGFSADVGAPTTGVPPASSVVIAPAAPSSAAVPMSGTGDDDVDSLFFGSAPAAAPVAAAAANPMTAVTSGDAFEDLFGPNTAVPSGTGPSGSKRESTDAAVKVEPVAGAAASRDGHAATAGSAAIASAQPSTVRHLCAVSRAGGSFEIYLIPEFRLLFTSPHFSTGPAVLSNALLDPPAAPIASGNTAADVDTKADVAVAAGGNASSSTAADTLTGATADAVDVSRIVVELCFTQLEGPDSTPYVMVRKALLGVCVHARL